MWLPHSAFPAESERTCSPFPRQCPVVPVFWALAFLTEVQQCLLRAVVCNSLMTWCQVLYTRLFGTYMCYPVRCLFRYFANFLLSLMVLFNVSDNVSLHRSFANILFQSMTGLFILSTASFMGQKFSILVESGSAMISFTYCTKKSSPMLSSSSVYFFLLCLSQQLTGKCDLVKGVGSASTRTKILGCHCPGTMC